MTCKLIVCIEQFQRSALPSLDIFHVYWAQISFEKDCLAITLFHSWYSSFGFGFRIIGNPAALETQILRFHLPTTFHKEYYRLSSLNRVPGRYCDRSLNLFWPMVPSKTISISIFERFECYDYSKNRLVAPLTSLNYINI
jgi:hypothetical protein